MYQGIFLTIPDKIMNFSTFYLNRFSLIIVIVAGNEKIHPEHEFGAQHIFEETRARGEYSHFQQRLRKLEKSKRCPKKMYYFIRYQR